MRLHHILVAVDEAPPIQLLLEQVGPLAIAGNAEVTCAHFANGAGAQTVHLAVAKARLAALGDGFAAMGLRVNTRVLRGEVETELERLAGYGDISMFTVVHHGARSRKLRSMAGRIVRRVQLPVLVLHAPASGPNPPPMRLDRIAVATDFRGSSEAGIRAALDLGRELGAHVEVLHVHEVSGLHVQVEPTVAWPRLPTEREGEHRAAVQRLAGQVAEHAEANVSGRVVAADSVPIALVAATLEGGNGLLVASTRGRSRLVELFAGGVTRDLIRLSPGPVLCLHQDDIGARRAA